MDHVITKTDNEDIPEVIQQFYCCENHKGRVEFYIKFFHEDRRHWVTDGELSNALGGLPHEIIERAKQNPGLLGSLSIEPIFQKYWFDLLFVNSRG